MLHLAPLLLCILLAGCVTHEACLPLNDSTAHTQGDVGAFDLTNAPADAIQCYASHGNKTAQLELGIRYDEGRGVLADPARAASLYAAAAAFTSGTIFIYSPPVGSAPGRTLPYRTGPDQVGLPDAMYRLALMRLDGRGVSKNVAKARVLLERAAAAGDAQAAIKLSSLPLE